jgi:hypothetical protein
MDTKDLQIMSIRSTGLGMLLMLSGASAQTRQTAADIYISPHGSDTNAGTLQRPLLTLDKALRMANTEAGKEVNVWLRGGTYYLGKTAVIRSGDFTPASLEVEAYNHEDVYISAGARLQLEWKPYRRGIYVAKVPDSLVFERLYVNGRLQVLARYPNYDPVAAVYNGTAADALSPQRVKRWKNPAGGYVHAIHANEWGSFDYLITGVKKDGELQLEGGWQNNRPAPMHKERRFVENIFEELDTVNEWYLDRAEHLLYYYPSRGLNLAAALVEVSRFRNSVELRGSPDKPLRNVRLKGLHFVHNERSFMDTREPLVRSDWTIYRGGAVLMDGTEHCSVADCSFTGLGGNAIMVSNYNRNDTINGCLIARIGASAVCFVGDAGAVRSPSFRYGDFIPYGQTDRTPGPLTNNYPGRCVATDNLIHNIGEIEKQATGVEIDMASEITVSHNSIYNTPRAGINIGDGCWGGHILEYNDVFNTVLETGDHGAFNSWGRDRFWAANRSYMDSLVAAHPELILLDAQRPNIIRNNRFRCDHGWDIDLDDGSTNYRIYNNVCLNGGIKLREGFYRIVENNILVNNSLHPHVWFPNSGDVFRHNIVTRKYFPIQVADWGREVDENLFPDSAALHAAQMNGTDTHSAVGDPLFVNAARGDYTVGPRSPALNIGFTNFSQDNFGVEKPSLKRIAGHPPVPALVLEDNSRRRISVTRFLGGTVKPVENSGERSAYGLPDAAGVIILSAGSGLLSKSGLQDRDVIIKADNAPVKDIKAFLDRCRLAEGKGGIGIEIIRNQQPLKLWLRL